MPSHVIKASEARKEKRLRKLAAEMQMCLPFCKEPQPQTNFPANFIELVRQPARFPAGWWSLYLKQGIEWRELYQANWIKSRKDADLPAVVVDPLLHKPSSDGALNEIFDLEWLERHPEVAAAIGRKPPTSVRNLEAERKTA